jgi:salicylate hydroxylase
MTGRVMLHFTDGTTHEADVVAGADGVRSNVRKFVAGEEASTKSIAYSNCAAYRGLTTIEALQTAGVETSLPVGSWPICWMGNGQVAIRAYYLRIVYLITTLLSISSPIPLTKV